MKEQIEEMATVLQNAINVKKGYISMRGLAEALYNAGYRKQSEVIDDFVKRLLDAFPEGNRDAKCPAIYYDDYAYIIEELAEEMKGGAE